MPAPVSSARLYAAEVSALNDDCLYAAARAAVWPERREKADRLRFRKDQSLSVGAGLLLQYALRQAGVTGSPELILDENGKPQLRSRPDVFFSLSHSGVYALCAVSGAPIGCDVQIAGPCRLALARRYFSPGEAALIAAQRSPQAQADWFYRIWTLKESFLKCTGLGLRLPMDSFEILPDGDAFRLRQSLDPRSFRLQFYDVLPGHPCALCEALDAGKTPLQLVRLQELL